MTADIITPKPKIFQRHDLEWLDYYETRKVGNSSSLAGNMSDGPIILSEENFKLLNLSTPYDEWVRREQDAVAHRRAELPFSHLVQPRPAHEVALIQGKRLDGALTSIPAINRIQADATLIQTPGVATIFAPADCIIATVVFPKEKSVGQIHIGFRGAIRGVIMQVMAEYAANNLNIREARVYFSPHARHGFPLNDSETREFTRIVEDLNEQDMLLISPAIEYRIKANPMVHITEIALNQFYFVGVKPVNVEVSPDDTFIEETLYSDYMKKERGANGRFGVIAGIKKALK